MTAPSTSELSFYTNKRLTDRDWSQDFTQVVEWLTGGYDLSASSLTTTGDITAGGKITAGLGFYGDGSNLTGVGGGGSSAGVGISQVEQLTESSKLFRMQLPTSLTNIISEPFIDGANFTGTLTGDLAQGALTIAITPTVTGQEPPKYQVLTITRASDGVTEEVIITGGSGGTYTMATAIQTASGFATSDPIRRNFCSLDTSAANAGILSGQAGTARYVQSHFGGQIDVGARTNGVIDWSVRMNSMTQGLKVDSIAAAPTNIIYLQADTDRTGEFSTSAPYNKIIVTKMSENGQKGVFQIGNGREYTITNVGSYSSSKIPITVADTYNNMDDEDSTATGGVTGLSAISGDGLTYWMAAAKTAIPKVSFVSEGVNESFVEVVPKKATAYPMGIAYPSYVHSHWKLDESSGNAINARAGATYNLSQTGTVASTAGKLGLCRGPYTASNYFSWAAGGSSSTVYDSATFAVEGWFKTSVTGAKQTIISKGTITGAGWVVWIDNTDNKLYVQKAGVANMVSSSTLTDGNWHYFYASVLSTSGAGNARLYVDGSVNSSQTGATGSADTRNLTVGLESGGSYYFQGLIDSLAYHSTVPATWTEVEAIIAKRYAGGVGKQYGSQFGLTISGTESNQTGQLATLRADIAQASLTATIPTIESKSLIVSGGLV